MSQIKPYWKGMFKILHSLFKQSLHTVDYCQVNYAVVLQKLGRSSSCVRHYQPSVVRAPWRVARRTPTSSVASPSHLRSCWSQSRYGTGAPGSDTGRRSEICRPPWWSALPWNVGEDGREHWGGVCRHRTGHLYAAGARDGSDRGRLGWD